MKNDVIKCMNCGKMFKDDTNCIVQNSREGKFKNMCPFCYSTNTRNTHEKAKTMTKFIYGSNTKGEDSHPKTKKIVIKKPNLDNETIAKEVIGWRQSLDATQNKRHISKKTDIETFVITTGGTFYTSTKSFTPIELVERKLKAQHQELLSPPDNFKRYKGWRYDRRLKHGRNN